MQLPSVDGLEFRAIPGYGDYAAASDGTIWSCKWGFWRMLAPREGNGGYKSVTLSKNNVKKCCSVHSLVCSSFHGPRPMSLERIECRHLNGNPRDNSSENLAWGTSKDNKRDAAKHGTAYRGERQWNARFNEDAVLVMRQLRKNGWSYPRIAAVFHAKSTVIMRIVKGDSWSHAGDSLAELEGAI